MTPAEKPDTTAAESERTSIITDGTAAGATAPAAAAPAGDPQPADADTTVQTPKPAGEPGGDNHTPPPWARVTADAQAEAGGDATQALPPVGNGHTPASHTPAAHAPGSYGTDPHGADPYSADPYSADSEPTINVPRPVVTGTAAGRLFGTSTDDDRSAAPPGIGGTPTATGASSTPPSALRRPGRGPRRANLQVKRFDPWSVLKLSLVLGVSLFFVWLVAVGVLYAVLDGMGVWDKVNGISSELLNASEGSSGDPLISAGRVFGIAAIIGAINIVLFSALATVGAFVYNVSADLAGGLEVTLAERE
ncbi:hypothetical protein UO65_6248 [Actinokineospora spheciospongiae]|uniref:DUF3566 domain-containing protein n=1 Tax=Actinokineospora spheciospongiae TaxID=909613 RepID=W7IP72_9PSEU|nr:hypothetical protein UO65_6248 [Actinokineospora spheciospongiae]